MSHQELLANLAHDYYVSQLSLAEVSEKYQLSRYLVNKYLEEARHNGTITIKISSPFYQVTELEEEFHKLFTIPKLHIIRDKEGQDHVLKFAAERIEAGIRKSHIVGTSWGSTIFGVIEAFSGNPADQVIFTQFMGENRKYNSAAGSMRMVEKAAQKFSSEYVTLSGPLYIADTLTRSGMIREIASQRAIDTAGHMDLLFTGLGTLASIQSIHEWRDNLSRLFPGVEVSKIAGMVYGRPYDIQGNFLSLEHDPVFGVGIKSILGTPQRIGVVKSKFKTLAALGALRGRVFTEMILSESVARLILDQI